MKSAGRLAILLLVACTATVEVSTNRYGLAVVPNRAAYERLARRVPEARLVDLASLGIRTDVRYATTSNFMHTVLYPVAAAWLRAPAAEALADANRELESRGLALKVYDAYRPYRVTVAMWERVGNPDFVADPAKGSRHNRGAAVDVTIVELSTGRELVMPTPYDDFTERARHDFADVPPDAAKHRALLRDVMTRHGFEPIASEWWHYDFRGWQSFDLMDVPLEELAPTK